jgi:effector-binding domain-containing protein
MSYTIEILRAESRPTLVIKSQARQEELSRVVPAACGEVWKFIKASGIKGAGRHVAVYLDGSINLEVGVELEQSQTGSNRVQSSMTPAGLVATTHHMGPYSGLGQAHRAICQWCAEHGHALAGPNWEIYGHWNDDPAQLRTDVFYLLTE